MMKVTFPPPAPTEPRVVIEMTFSEAVSVVEMLGYVADTCDDDEFANIATDLFNVLTDEGI